MKRVEGTCRFCNQLRFVMAEPEWTQEQIDESATWDCDCEEALEARERANSVDAIKMYINENMPELPTEAREGIKGMLLPVAAGMMQSVSIKVDDDTNIKIGIKKSRLFCKRTVKDDLTIDAYGGH